jgi:AcrR family transcriptional regulator
MARSGEETRTRILRAAYRLFYAEGFTRTGVDAIAAVAGITKRTLYYHFDSKDALVAEVLDQHHLHALAEVRSWGGDTAHTPAEFLRNLFEQLELWAERPNWHSSGFTRLTMELADLPGHPARRAAHRHKAAVEAWLTRELGMQVSVSPSCWPARRCC